MERDSLLELLDAHFEKDMMMSPGPSKEGERHYSDPDIYMIFIYSPPVDNSESGLLRILIRNWKSNKAFSKDVKIDSVHTKESLVQMIRHAVYSYSGDESRDMLNEWYEKRKPEIRDRKISDLGI